MCDNVVKQFQYLVIILVESSNLFSQHYCQKGNGFFLKACLCLFHLITTTVARKARVHGDGLFFFF